MPQFKLSKDDLAAALVGLEFERDRLSNRMDEIREMLGGGRTKSAEASDTGKRKRKFSAAARRRMRISQQLRWKKIKEAAAPQPSKAAKPKKRKLSAAGRKAISIAAKKRWAAIKAARKTV